MKHLLACLFILGATPGAFAQNKPTTNPGEKVKVPEPIEIGSARDKYREALAPFRAKITDQIKTRVQSYIAALKDLELRETAAGHGDALEGIRKERNAYSAGGGTVGFDAANKKIPGAARDLRRAYDRDVAKFVSDAIPAARPAAEVYTTELGRLEQVFIKNRDSDGVLAIRSEKEAMKGALTNPLAGDDNAIIGNWVEGDGFVMKFHAGGRFTTNNPAQGKWEWTSRSKNQFKATFDRWRKGINFEITPDGFGLVGTEVGGGAKSLSRTQ